jgi:uncharacterized sulfatase
MKLVPALVLTAWFLSVSNADGQPPPPARPNILWLTSEDHGPHMGCYGDRYAATPNIDRLASQGVIYARAWSNAPVCAPARTTLISGMYCPSTGSEHMRSMVPYPKDKQMFPQLLRGAGYYCTNNSKEDYNLAKPGRVWDESSRKAHWKNRAAGEPFFAVFNSTRSHESRLRVRPHKQVHDPAQVRIPAYHPDTPEVRQDWAQYYDVVTLADDDAGRHLRELKQAGLEEETIVFYFADHGSGMPRNKRSPCNSGLHVPLAVYIPQKWRHLAPADYVPGGKSERLVSFVDFAPTVLSLAGIEPPAWMQGHAFLGKFATKPQPYVFGFRGRMDERLDLARSVTDGRYVYVRNYMPHLPSGQHVAYMFATPTTRVWKRLHDAGKLASAQEIFWKPKPPEELYDLQSDPDEVANLAGSADHQEILQKLRRAQQGLARSIRDVGFLPEGELFSRAPGVSPYELGHDEKAYPFERIFAMAETASMLKPESLPKLKDGLRDGDSAVRYWAAMGILMRGTDGVSAAHEELWAALEDRSPYVRVAAASALSQFSTDAEQSRAILRLIPLADRSKQDVFTVIAALNALDALGKSITPVGESIKKLPSKGPLPDARYAPYVPSLLEGLPVFLKE